LTSSTYPPVDLKLSRGGKITAGVARVSWADVIDLPPGFGGRR
jgi:hypothetical protein